MQFYSCKCGHTVKWTNMAVPGCAGCDVCKTQLTPEGENTTPMQPHRPFTRTQYGSDGKVEVVTRCTRCDVRLPNVVKE